MNAKNMADVILLNCTSERGKRDITRSRLHINRSPLKLNLYSYHLRSNIQFFSKSCGLCYFYVSYSSYRQKRAEDHRIEEEVEDPVEDLHQIVGKLITSTLTVLRISLVPTRSRSTLVDTKLSALARQSIKFL